MVIGAGIGAKTISRSFDITDRHRQTVETKADEIADQLLESKGWEQKCCWPFLPRRACGWLHDEEGNHG